MKREDISLLAAQQRAFFGKGESVSLSFRRAMLKRLLSAIELYESRLSEALWTDLHKSYEEAYLTEISIVKNELNNHLRHLRKWSKPMRKTSPIAIWPASSKVMTEPLGNALIIAPWNYPVHLLLNPLVGAISAGCTAMLKPSPYTPHVSAVLCEMIRSTFATEYIAIVEGHREVNQWLLDERWDMIFFTGSPSLGKMVMEAAAKHLTPVVLELGGKSPCIVDKDADVRIAAKRIAWGKVLNAGQTCIAPDYLLIHEDIREQLLEMVVEEWKQLLQPSAEEAKHYVRIVNDKAMERLIGYLKDGDIYYGGRYDTTTRYMQPTLLTNVSTDAPVMQEEIFGPIFPVLTFNAIDDAIAFVVKREKPLALYYFGTKGEEVLRRTSSGGACINDVIMHIVGHDLPFGGVGHSGMGAYHGQDSFMAFSHRRTVIKTPTWIDMPFRYMPYRWWKWIKRLV